MEIRKTTITRFATNPISKDMSPKLRKTQKQKISEIP